MIGRHREHRPPRCQGPRIIVPGDERREQYVLPAMVVRIEWKSAAQREHAVDLARILGKLAQHQRRELRRAAKEVTERRARPGLARVAGQRRGERHRGVGHQPRHDRQFVQAVGQAVAAQIGVGERIMGEHRARVARRGGAVQSFGPGPVPGRRGDRGLDQERLRAKRRQPRQPVHRHPRAVGYCAVACRGNADVAHRRVADRVGIARPQHRRERRPLTERQAAKGNADERDSEQQCCQRHQRRTNHGQARPARLTPRRPAPAGWFRCPAPRPRRSDSRCSRIGSLPRATW